MRDCRTALPGRLATPDGSEEPSYPSIRAWQTTLLRSGVLLGHDGQFRQFGGRDADAFEALGHDAVRRRQQADEQVHGGDGVAVVVDGSRVRLAQKAHDVVREELAVEDEERLLFAIVLVE